LYESYSKISFFDILRHEKNRYGITNLISPGLAAANASFVIGHTWRQFENLFFRKKKKTRKFSSKLIVGLVKM